VHGPTRAHAFDYDDVAIYQNVDRKPGQLANTLPLSRRYIYGSH